MIRFIFNQTPPMHVRFFTIAIDVKEWWRWRSLLLSQL